MFTATLNGQTLSDDVDVSIESWPSVDYLTRSVQSGRVSLAWRTVTWAHDYRGQSVDVHRDADGVRVFRGRVASQSVDVGRESSTIKLGCESGERPTRISWPTDRLEDAGRFPLDVSGVVQRIFGRVESAPLPEVRTGFRLVARNPIYESTIDVYEGDTAVALNRPVQRIEDGLGDVYSVIEVDPGLDGKTLRSGPVTGYIPNRTRAASTTLRDVVDYLDDLVVGGWALAARVLPEEVSRLPVGMLITDTLQDVIVDMLDRLGGQYGFTVDISGGWSLGPDLYGQKRRVPGTLLSRSFIDSGLVANVRVEWGTSTGNSVGTFTLPTDNPLVVAMAHRELPTHEIRAVDVPSEEVAGVVARRIMSINGRHRERWSVEVPGDVGVAVGDALDMDEIDRVEVSGLRGLVESVSRGVSVDTIQVLV